MPASGENLSDVTPNSDVDEDFFGDVGKKFVVAPQMDLAMFEFMRSNGKLEWFSSLCDKYYATCGDVVKTARAARTSGFGCGVEVSRGETGRSVSQTAVVKPQLSTVPRRIQGSRKSNNNRAVGSLVDDENRYDFPNPGVVDAYGDGYCYLNLIRARDIVAVAKDLGPSPDLQKFFSLPARNYIPVNFWKYRGVVVDQKGVHVSGSLGPDTFYGFASAVKQLFPDSVVLREISGEVDGPGFDLLVDVTPRTLIGKEVGYRPKVVYMVEDACDLFDATYRFVAPGIEVVGPDNKLGYKVDVLLGSDRARAVGQHGSVSVRPFQDWKCHKPDQQYSSGFCYLLLFQSAYRDSLARKLGKNPEWSEVLKVSARALEIPKKLAALRVQVDKVGISHVGVGEGYDLRAFLVSLVGDKRGLAVGWDLDTEGIDLPSGCDGSSKVGFVAAETTVALHRLYVVQSSADLQGAIARFSKPGIKVLTLDQAKHSMFAEGILLLSSDILPSDRLGLPPGYVVWAHSDWAGHEAKTKYGDGYCYLRMFRCTERDRLLLSLGSYPTWRDIMSAGRFNFADDSQLQNLKVLKLGSNYHIGEFGVSVLSVIPSIGRIASLCDRDSTVGWSMDLAQGLSGFDLDSKVGVADLGMWLRGFSPDLADDDVAIVSSSAALLGSVDKARLRMLEAVGDTAIASYIAMDVARSGGTAEQYQTRRSTSASNANLSRLFNDSLEMVSCVRFAGGVNPAVGVVGAKAFEAIVGAVAFSGGEEAVSRFLAQFAI